MYIHNRLPNSSIKNKTPHELWFGKVPTYDHLRPFGCITYAHIPEQRRAKQSKFDDRGNRGCFIGYDSQDTYIYYDFIRKKFDKSHNINIHESLFPDPKEFDKIPVLQSVKEPTLPSELSRIIHDSIVVEHEPSTPVINMVISGRVSDIIISVSYNDAMSRKEATEWKKAMDSEIKDIEDNKTWELWDLPYGRQVIGTKWVFTVKSDENYVIKELKARLVAKGYMQIDGFDFGETFAPVVRMESVQTLFAITAYYSLTAIHLDATKAFLHAYSDVELYVQQPDGYVNPRYPHKVLRLNKSLYGIKQAPRLWYLALLTQVIKLGFKVCETDPCVYVSFKRGVIMAIYVDDTLVIGKTQEACEQVHRELSQHFKFRNLGFPTQFSGLTITSTPTTISINQEASIDKALKKYKMSDCAPCETPLEPSHHLVKRKWFEKPADQTLYRQIVGSINHIAYYSRPDITFAASKLSQFNSDSTTVHLKAARHVLRYLKATKHFKITYGGAHQFNAEGYSAKLVPKELFEYGFADADYAGDKDDRKSTTGYVFILNNGPISWGTHKQSTVALSTMEAEYMAISDAAWEALARNYLLTDLAIRIPPPLIHGDNRSALNIAQQPIFNRQAKHIEVKYHFIREKVAQNMLEVEWVSTKSQTADILTKALSVKQHRDCLMLLQLN